MAEKRDAAVTRLPQPIILIRGFGGLDVEDERRIAYQGFNDGTVYPQKRGENYIYEGLILRLLKSHWKYFDATNVVGYYRSPAMDDPGDLPEELSHLDRSLFFGQQLVVDPAMALYLLRAVEDPLRTVWIFRYYDLDDRKISAYGRALVRLIDFVQALATEKGKAPTKVNIIAHSMGGLIVREAVQVTYPFRNDRADRFINKIVTLGTPHQGIAFQILRKWLFADASDELEHFNPDFQRNPENQAAFVNFHKSFPLERLLTVVGTNYGTYGVRIASYLNRLFGSEGEYGPNYNRSDGLVKQTNAQVPGAPRTFVHKCHGGDDSLVTSREAYEIANRFFHGNLRARLRLVKAQVKRGLDFFGKSEIFFGVCIKPRKLDFDLFHQSKEAENCYGPFRKPDLTDSELAFNWAGDGRLIWEGWLDTSQVATGDLVLRLDVYVSERDLFGLGFSDNVIFHKQYYVRAQWKPKPLQLYLHADESFASPGFTPSAVDKMKQIDGAWHFEVGGTGFAATLAIELGDVKEVG